MVDGYYPQEIEKMLISIFYPIEKDLYDKDSKKLYPILNILYSRVVDKFNLSPNRGTEGYYFYDEYDIKHEKYYSVWNT